MVGTKVARLSVAPSNGQPAVEGTGTADQRPAIAISLGALVLVVLWAYLAEGWWGDEAFRTGAKPPVPLEGLTIFAVFFVAAAALERLIEPVARLLGNDKKVAAAGAKAEATAQVEAAAQLEAAAQRSAVEPDAAPRAAAATAVAAAAQAKAEEAVTTGNRAVALWALASIVGIYAAATTKLYLLTTVGVASPTRFQEVLATGLIIGGGTKPLHELVELMAAKKEAAKAATP